MQMTVYQIETALHYGKVIRFTGSLLDFDYSGIPHSIEVSGKVVFDYRYGIFKLYFDPNGRFDYEDFLDGVGRIKDEYADFDYQIEEKSGFWKAVDGIFSLFGLLK
jgi:hypothetical protein